MHGAFLAADASGKQTELIKLISRIDEARQRTDAFFDLLAPSSLYLRPISERHRVIFYVGHLEAFDWNLLSQRVCGRPSLHAEFEARFAFGIDPVDGNLPCDTETDWPGLDEILLYRRRARQAVDDCLHELVDLHPLHMAIEHRLMHLETLAYMLPGLPLDGFVGSRIAAEDRQPDSASSFSPGYARTGPPGHAKLIEIPAGTAELGRTRDGMFGWDNEFGLERVEVPRFQVQARNVTNGEFLAFVQAGGYGEPTLWEAADFAWLKSCGRAHPDLWRKQHDGDSYLLRTPFAEVPLPLDWPASVSLAEARAYARYLNYVEGHAERGHLESGRGRWRLPSEAEYHRAAYAEPQSGSGCEASPRAFPWGNAAPVPLVHGNFGCRRHAPANVAAFPAGDSALGVADLIGNGWEWTDTPFAPFSGFASDPLYLGYSQPFFDKQHFVLKGASARTHTTFLRRSFRNWFQPHYPYVFAAFRCVRDAE